MRRRRVKTNLNVAGLFVAALLLSLSFTLATPQEIAGTAERMLANPTIGVSAGVVANPYNTLAQKLGDKEVELSERERSLAERESANQGIWSTEGWALASFAISIIVLLLVALNFYFDVRRGARGGKASPFSINLR